MSTRMPTVYLPHGGGPWPFTHEPLFPGADWSSMDAYMRGLGTVVPRKPDAILVVSAHWEESEPTLLTSPKPPMLYDYSGFPPESYEVRWPAPGAPELAARTEALLEGAGFEPGSDARRGFDHGTFVPLKLAYPEAEVPTYQLSLKRGLDPETHLRVGEAIAPLRDEGVFIVGSGMSYHNMQGFGRLMRGDSGPAEDARRFDDWLAQSMSREPSKRREALVEWSAAPAAREAHPREEHLIPLHVVSGAASDGRASLPFRDVVMGAAVSSVHFV